MLLLALVVGSGFAGEPSVAPNVALAAPVGSGTGRSARNATFFPGSGPDSLDYDALLRQGKVLGRTGKVMVHAESWALDGVAGIASRRDLSGGVYVIVPSGGVDDLEFARALHGRPGVRWATPDVILPLVPLGLPDDPLYADEWHLENTGQGGRVVDVDINASQAWAYATGAGITIAVLDSGVQLDHPDLRAFPGHDYIDADDDPSPSTDDSAPHGTGVAGIAAGVGNNAYGVAGVAYDADVYAIRLIGGNTTLQDLYESFVEAVDAGASVLSNSWGFSGGCEGYNQYEEFREMYNYAEENGRGGLGSVVVFAAGNDGCDIQNDGLLATKKILVVAALEADDERASYSNFGKWVDIAAPTGLLTTDITPGGYGSYGGDDAFADGFSGTSGATPVVAGVVALMMEANPRITSDQVRDVLCQTATRNDLELADFDEDGWSPYYGCGRIDAGAAVAAVANSAPETPIPTEGIDASESLAVLSWTAPADPDDDVLGYRVRWLRNESDHTDDVYGTSLDLSDDSDAGDVISWTVAAFDVWGEGPASSAQTMTVYADPSPVVDTGAGWSEPDVSEYTASPAVSCSSAPGFSGFAGVSTALWALGLRQRGRPVSNPERGRRRTE